jgi:rSAM/selenodomain-associated transferase 2
VRLSAVVPAFHEPAIGALVAQLRNECDEVLVVDGGSTDDTAALAQAAGAVLVGCDRGRGRQLDAGIGAANGDVLWFVHADSTLPPGAGAAVRHAARVHPWGCFAVRVESEDPRLRWCGRYMTVRARRTGSATGDMAIWARRDLIDRVGGFGARGVCEDLDFALRAREVAPCCVLPLRVGTSARRWEAEGVTRTMLRMWAVRGGFHLGLPDRTLTAMYRRNPR